MDPSTGIIIATTLLLSAFFSGTEIAFVTANRLRIELESKQGKLQARILSFFLKRPSRFIGAMLVGNNVMLVVYGILMAEWMEPLIFDLWPNQVAVLLIQTVVSTVIVLIFGEFLPKVLFRSNPNGILNSLSFVIVIMYGLLWLPSILIIGLSEGVLLLVTGKSYGKEELNFGRIDLDNLVRETTDQATDKNKELDHEIEIFRNALDFSKMKARDCMVPRTDIVAMEVERTVEDLKEKFIETGYSKILIYRDSIDNIIGYTHSYGMFRNPDSIKSILMPISILPESMDADEVLELLMKQRRAIAVVVDEYGGTAGIITIEDIIEQIFGDIEDEHDEDELLNHQVNEREWHFSGRMEIAELNKAYGFQLPEHEDYETLAGYLMHVTGDIPASGDIVDESGYRFTIMQMQANRIDTVRMEKVEEES
jgi:CBS domain containing-hemolysin-like protein